MATDAEKASTPQDFSWAGLAAATGAAGLGGFIFDRYIRGNKNLRKNLAMAAGFGAGGALASTAYQLISERNRVAENKKALEEAGKAGAKSATVTSAEGTTQKVDPKTGKELPKPKGKLERGAEKLESGMIALGHFPTAVAGGNVVHKVYQGVKHQKDKIDAARTAGERLVQDLAKRKESIPLTTAEKITLQRAGLDPVATMDAAAKGKINIAEPKAVKAAEKGLKNALKKLNEVKQRVKQATPTAPPVAAPGAPAVATEIPQKLLQEQAAARRVFNAAKSKLREARKLSKSNVVLNPAIKTTGKAAAKNTAKYIKGAIGKPFGKRGLISTQSLASMAGGGLWEAGLAGANNNVYRRLAKKIQEVIK